MGVGRGGGVPWGLSEFPKVSCRCFVNVSPWFHVAVGNSKKGSLDGIYPGRASHDTLFIFTYFVFLAARDSHKTLHSIHICRSGLSCSNDVRT